MSFWDAKCQDHSSQGLTEQPPKTYPKSLSLASTHSICLSLKVSQVEGSQEADRKCPKWNRVQEQTAGGPRPVSVRMIGVGLTLGTSHEGQMQYAHVVRSLLVLGFYKFQRDKANPTATADHWDALSSAVYFSCKNTHPRPSYFFNQEWGLGLSTCNRCFSRAAENPWAGQSH